ncbi:hypothetical protein F2Q68_00017210 [Brassica cretica]|uniref:Tyrosine specific protein phosphatases domain-containing protein n=1 Tax=Brassica cretica TaxID=69181 RepID=A0A8S9HEC7_BRACR|nr:hypothetical protein F2Q68_00017210 [Brassica cretica]
MSSESPNLPATVTPDAHPPPPPPAAVEAGSDDSPKGVASKLSASGISTWAKSLKVPQPFASTSDVDNSEKSAFAKFTSGLGLRLSPKSPQPDETTDGASSSAQPGLFGAFTKGLVDTSKNAVKAVQVKARHAVSQNKRRYQEGGFDLDLTYITENIIAMGFPAGDMSSGFFGYVEGFYRNQMEEVINFLETQHKGKYKVYNLCSERLYDVEKSAFAKFTSGLGLRLSPKSPQPDETTDGASSSAQPGLFGAFTKGLVDTSKNAVKAVQVKARHAVSQNKRRYQEGGFDLDLTYITENIIAMGFPAGDMSSGFFGYVEGFYRNQMEEVINFLETQHKGKYKVYNLCSERLYDVSLFEGKVASFPFDDHNCPPIHLITSFCQSAYSWLKEDIENVVVVHCKAGMARTGLMICSLLLYLKFFPTAEECMDFYNQKRCVDGKGLVLPSQIATLLPPTPLALATAAASVTGEPCS